MITLLAILVGILAVVVAALVWMMVGRTQRANGVNEAVTAQLKEIDERLRERFKAAAGEALADNQKILLEQTKAVVEAAQKFSQSQLQKESVEFQKVLEPFKENLGKLQKELQAMEEKRAGAYSGLNEKLQEMTMTQKELRTQTGNLVSALNNTNARGQWGELQLKRAVEFAGMTAYVDYDVQMTTKNDAGDPLRADMIVKLPSGRTIVVDSKVPMDAFLKSTQTNDSAAREAFGKSHAAALKKHAAALGAKKYFEGFSPSPEFVVLFLNIESSLKVALDAEPRLLEDTLAMKVIIATPTTLIALLKAASYGWGEAKAHDKANKIIELGKELFERLNVVMKHWADVGSSLEKSVEAYNKAKNSTESRLLVSVRKISAEKDWELPAIGSGVAQEQPKE